MRDHRIKGILWNKARVYNMRAHALSQDKEYLT